jgi:hypothetical protein
LSDVVHILQLRRKIEKRHSITNRDQFPRRVTAYHSSSGNEYTHRLILRKQLEIFEPLERFERLILDV